MNASTLTPTDRRRLSAQCEAILARLRRGPATNVELAAVCLNSRARISELRDRGHEIVCDRGEGGVNVYRLIAREPEQMGLGI